MGPVPGNVRFQHILGLALQTCKGGVAQVVRARDEAEEAFGVKVKYTDITYTVSGLASVNTFDAFDGVDVEFSGISPDGRATVNSLPTAAEAQGLYYTLDENSGLSNGDTVTLTVNSKGS